MCSARLPPHKRLSSISILQVRSANGDRRRQFARPDAGELDKMSRFKLAGASKMKVHPGMLMKTMESRFQVPGIRCQVLADGGGIT